MKRAAEENRESECNKTQKLEEPQVVDQKEAEKEAFYDWLRGFDERILTYPNGDLMGYGWGRAKLQNSGWFDLFFNGRSGEYYKEHPEKKEEDQVLCQDICPLSVLHGLVELFETRPGICYGSYEMQVVCHVIKSSLVKFGRDIPTFLKRVLSLFDEPEFQCKIYGEQCKVLREKKTPKQLQLAIAVFLTENFSFLSTRELPDGTSVYDVRVENMKDPGLFSDVVIRNLFPGKTGWNYSLETLASLNTYLEKCLAKWRDYMYGTQKKFLIKPMKAETRTEEVIRVQSYFI